MEILNNINMIVNMIK